MSKQDRAYITRMVEGVTEQRIKLDYIINQFSKTKVNKCKPLIRCVLRMGTYELFFMDSVPDSAACNLSVKLAVDHGFGSLRGFVNGVLRNIARNRDGIKYPDKNTSPLEYYSVEYSVPVELVEILLSVKRSGKMLFGIFFLLLTGNFLKNYSFSQGGAETVPPPGLPVQLYRYAG